MPRSTRHQLGSSWLVRAQLPFTSNSGLRFPSTAFSTPLETLWLDDCSAVFLRARFSVKMNLNQFIIVTIKKNRERKREGQGKGRKTKAKPRTTAVTTINKMQTVSLPVNRTATSAKLRYQVQISVWHRSEPIKGEGGVAGALNEDPNELSFW